MSNKDAVVTVLRNLQVDLMRTSNQYRRDGDGMLSELYKADSTDVSALRVAYETTADFFALIDSIMSMDTAIRERVLEELEVGVGRDPIEETGLVSFIR